MKYKLFTEVMLDKDIPSKKLKKGDLATIVEYHPSLKIEDGYSLEVFNVVGDSIAIVIVPESDISPLNEGEVFNVRPIEAIPS